MNSHIRVTVEPSKKLTLDRHAILQAYKARKLAARLYAFDPHPGQRISSWRSELQNEPSQPIYKLEHVKTKIVVCYKPTSFNRSEALEILKERVKERRQDLRRIYVDCTRTGRNRYTLTHDKNGDILRLWCEKCLSTYKTPADNSRHIGVEIECMVPVATDRRPLLDCKEFINVGSDGSISPDSGYVGIEIRLLANTRNYKERVTKLCDALAVIGARVNRSTGLHVHLDVRGFDVERIKKEFANLVRAQKYLALMVPASRRRNTYCMPTRNANPYEMHDRYHAINGCSVNRHRTIEVRLHGGTVNAEKINNWVSLLLRVATAPIMERAPRTVDTFVTRCRIPQKLTTYIKTRIDTFTRDAQDSEVTANV